MCAYRERCGEGQGCVQVYGGGGGFGIEDFA